MDTNGRSISGHHIPFSRDSQNDDDAFQNMTAFSPPAVDNWLNRYSKQKKEVSKKKEIVGSSEGGSAARKFTVPKANQLEDPCKRYIESSEIAVKSNKSLGTDDHFKTAACSKNLLKVCEKLMTKKESGSVSSNTTSFDSIETTTEDDFDAELSLMNEKSRMEFYRNKYGNRRDSQSLPASPKMERKHPAPVAHNPYFTITKPETRQESSISFLTNLFGITGARHPTEAQTKKASLAQKYEVKGASSPSSFAPTGGDLAKAESQQQQHQQQQQQQASSRQLTPKPHPYREMNIFSPTSM